MRSPLPLFACAAMALGCHGISEVRTLPRKNPMSWTFEASLESVTKCMESSAEELVVDRWGNRAEIDRYAAGPEPLRNLERYELDLESAGYGSRSVHSEVYLYGACPLGVYGHWRVTARPIFTERTRVEVVPRSLHVHNYRCFYIGHPWGCAIAVEPSTMEEYRILLAIGACLGVSDMPPIVSPAGTPPQPAKCE